MALRAEYTLHYSDLGGFLEESIWEERDGSMLSVLSALARLDKDPWEEANRLALMSREAAAVSLAEILALLPSNGPRRPSEDLKAIAHRLVLALPDRGGARKGDTPDQDTKTIQLPALAIVVPAALVFALGFMHIIGFLF